METDKFVKALNLALGVSGIKLSMDETEEIFMKVGVEIAKKKGILK